DGQTGARHDEGFTHRAGDLVERSPTGDADGDERVIDAPHRAEQTDEGGRAADRGEHGAAPFETCVFLVDDAAHGTGEEFGFGTRFSEAIHAMTGVMTRGHDRVIRQVRERFVRMLLFEMPLHRVEGGHVLEGVKKTRRAATAQQHLQAFGDDEIPGGERHQQQYDEQRLADCVRLREKMSKAEALIEFHTTTYPCRVNAIGTSTQPPTGVSPRLAGMNFHCSLTVLSADSSSRA